MRQRLTLLSRLSLPSKIARIGRKMVTSEFIRSSPIEPAVYVRVRSG